MRVAGQTLFLGASVISFSTNIGWGGSNSSITVELIEDVQPFGRTPFRKFDPNKSADYGDLGTEDYPALPKDHKGNAALGNSFYTIPHYVAGNYKDNHYYECIGDDCYVDELGRPYNTSPTKKEKNVPGKIYYQWINNRFVSQYWYFEDPGFFATGTRINPNGVYEPGLGRDLLASNLYIYDIINTPVYFKFDNFEFIGLVKSWERNNRPGGITYSVTIESFDELLDNCHIILQSFNGAIFDINSIGLQSIIDDLENTGILQTNNLLNNTVVGGPVNFSTSNGQNFDKKIERGNLPNVFNVYGFLESMGNNGFGGSKLNSEGLRANDIIDSIHALTSSNNFEIRNIDKAFSPFGRILTKTITNARTGNIVTNLNKFGIISPSFPTRSAPNPSLNYNSFRLDLSSLPRPPDNYRIQGNPSLSISAFIKQLSEDTGVDLLSVVIPVYDGLNTNFVIKVLTVDRKNYEPIYKIPEIVSQLEKNNYLIENSSFGQEKNNNYTRKLVFGGNQQRLYQVKNYRLSYNQTNLVYNTILKKFVNFSSNLLKNRINKIRNPDLSSTRNKTLSDFIHPTESPIFLRDDEYANTRFTVSEKIWNDKELGREEDILQGNYTPTVVEDNKQTSSNRYIPLLDDVISPYFGLKNDIQFPIGDDTNEFRSPRPVLLDTWTNQITIVFDINELPVLSVGELLSVYDPNLLNKPINSGFNDVSAQILPVKQKVSQQTDGASTGINPTRTLSYTSPGFTIKETELRFSNFDAYLTYCLGKSLYSKPDLFTMLVNAYKQKGIFIGAPSAVAASSAPTNINDVGGVAAHNNNISQYGVPSNIIAGFRTKMGINWDIYLNHNFIKDLQILFNFIKTISDKYYGKEYAIKAPALYSYKDTQYANVQIPSSLGNISVYQGSNETFYDYEVTEGAWEEYGNYIDDSIVCGDSNWHILRNDDGLIPTIIGYNNSFNIDDLTRFWCQLDVAKQKAFLEDKGFYKPNLTTEDIQKELRRLARDNFACFNSDNTLMPSLDISGLSYGSYVIINKKIPNKDSFDRIVKSSKLYTKSSTNKIVFLNPIKLSDPRIIVETPGIALTSTSYSYNTDPNLSVISNIAIEDYCILANLGNNITNNNLNSNIKNKELEYLQHLLGYVTPLTSNLNRLVPQGPSINNSPQNDSLNPKMATPCFAAIPLKSNRAVYGPWTNYPGLVMTRNLADNLIGNVKVEQNSDYVPWLYGGMSFLDKAVSYNMSVDVNYQNILENGRVSIIGTPIFGIGGLFSYEYLSNIAKYIADTSYIIYDNNYYKTMRYNVIFIDSNRANPLTLTYNTTYLEQTAYKNSPVISNISLQMTTEGTKTTYSFQTYNPKTGLFNKQISDNIKKQNTQFLKFNKLLSAKVSPATNKNILELKENAKTSREPYSIAKNATRLFGTSPVELIIGQSSDFVPYDGQNIDLEKFNKTRRHHHWAGIIPADETGAELLNDYDSKSAMSLDGLLSPVSFYPTRLNSTYSLSDHSIKESDSNIDPICPRCSNKRSITITYIDYSAKENEEDQNKAETITMACPVCSRSKLKVAKQDKNPNKDKGLPDINLYSLNPIVVSKGEFKNPYALENDIPKHSIIALARGNDLPTSNNNFVLPINNNNGDYEEFDPNNPGLLMNQRFFAIRGPMMLHGWGFDTEGYPVPNASEQPLLLDPKNRPLRFVLNTENNLNINDLSKPGQYIPEEGQQLGDIITKDYTWVGNRWKKSNKKSKFFHTKWAERPDLWPVGPIDLRWDDQRKVWDASGGGCKEEILPPFIVTNTNDESTLQEFLENKSENKCPYKNVYITLENDMVKEDDYDSTYPTKGFIDDVEYNKEPLQNGYRRLVYIVDKTGYTAPKGTKLLCRYDRLSGFYEPISKPAITAIGSIGSGHLARINAHYIQGRRAGVTPSFAITFDNPLNLNVITGNSGIFMFLNGKWILSATK